MYVREDGSKRLLLVVQVDDCLHAWSPGLASEFEQFLQNQFHTGFTESRSLHIMGARFTQDESAKNNIDAKDKLDLIQP